MFTLVISLQFEAKGMYYSVCSNSLAKSVGCIVLSYAQNDLIL